MFIDKSLDKGLRTQWGDSNRTLACWSSYHFYWGNTNMPDCYLRHTTVHTDPYSSRSYRDVLSTKREHQTDHRIQSIPLKMPGIYAGSGSEKHLLLTISQPGKGQPAMSCLTVSVSDQHRQLGEIDLTIQGFMVWVFQLWARWWQNGSVNIVPDR